jgi:thiol-disulfide isomerase/thioredoxin
MCGPCKAEMPAFSRFYLEQKDAGLLLVGIDASEGEAQVREFICQQDLKFPVAIDQDGEMQKKYQVSAYPTTVVIGADGRVSLYRVGMIENVQGSLGTAFFGQRDAVQRKAGIDREAYLLAQPPVEAKGQSRSKEDLLRSQQIAGAMNCPCGCDYHLADCICRTATQAKKKLRAMDLKTLSDMQAIAQINREFCPGPAK